MTTRRWLGSSLVLIAVMWSGVARAAVTISADPVSVGNVVVGASGSTTAQLSSSVNGVNVDIVLSATCTGGGTGTFTLSTPAGLTNVNLNNAVTLTAMYQPTTRGLRQCSVNVYDTGTTTLQVSFNVSATGVAPVVSAPASIAFAATRWNDLAVTTTNSQTLSVTNATTDAGQTLSVSLAIGGADASDFTISGAPTLPLAPGATGQWTITMNPSAAGVRSATLTITSNDPVTPMKVVSLLGSGTNAVISATDVTMPSAVIGGAATTANITVVNGATTDVGTLTATAATMSGGSWFSFGTGSGCAGGTACTLTSFTMPPNKTIPVRCQVPSGETGTQMATVTITSDSDPGGDSTAVLTCTALQHASANATTLAFGDVEVGKTTAPQTLTITNTGGQTLTISNAGVLANATEYGVVGPVGAQTTIVPPNGTTSWDITCHPTSQGSKNTSFRITSNTDGAAAANIDVPLTCNGQQGVLAISPTAFNFGGVREFFSVPTTFTLSNTGNVAVTNITPTLDSKLLGFSITSPAFPINLAANTSITVTVQFAPQSGGDGCQVVNAGDCAIRFSGTWGTTPTTTTATTVVQGDGLVTGYDTSPSAPNVLDFGDVRFDLTRPLQIQVINTAGTPIQLRGASISGGTALAGEFAITSCVLNGTAVTCPTMAAPINNFTGTMIVNVTCDPANRVAMFDSTFTVTSDLMVNPSRTVPLRCNSITAGLGVTPGMMVDFGATDLDKVPVAVTLPIAITNSGTAPMTLGNGVKAGATNFATSSLLGLTIQPSATYMVMVTYTPTIEKPSNQPDVGSITFPVTGVFGNPNLTIQLSGYGVDRHIAVAPVPTFPDTFKNPGDQAPMLPVTITNNGDANLNVSAVMLTNDPVWTLVNPDPTTVAGRGRYDFNVRFSPTMAGKAPIGKLTIVNNDNGMPMVSVDLNGNGLDRNVAMGPGEINLGYTGIGIPIRLSELTIQNTPAPLLNVASADSMHMFTIASIAIEGGDGTFVIEDENGNAPTALELGPLASKTFDVVFTPTAETDFEADAYLLLDQDPQPQAVVKLRGRGLYVDGGGGGGCATTHGSGIAMIAIVLAMILRRRRVALLAVLGIGSAHAETRNLSLTIFDPTPATTGTTFHVQDATVGDNGDYAVTAVISYANTPLVLRTVQNDDAAVKNRTTFELGFAYALRGRFEVGLRMPLYMQSGDAVSDPTMAFNVAPGSGAAFGDLTVHGKMNLGVAPALAGRLAYGLGAALTVPTATRDEFAGNELPTGRAVFLLSHVAGPLATTINAGAIVRAKAEYANIHQGSGMTWGAGASYRVLDSLWLVGELFGDVIPGGRSTQPAAGEAMGEAQLAASIEWLVGAQLRVARAASLGIAGGRGLTRGVGAPAARIALTFSYTPGADELKPLRPPRPLEAPRDSDDDGIMDSADACPHEPEDKDQFEDSDGCPDPDNDQDGIADSADKCPLDPEDKDQFEDENGCPDLDNDFDGVPDAKDKCPFASEDKDGFQDQDGCPDPDNDGDGLLDTVDKCPLQPETINGNADDDGCPDKGDSLVVVNTDRLELLESIQWNRDQISRSSRNVLAQLGATLRAHPEVLRIRITVYVNPTKDTEADQRISEARARAIKEWLVDYGIDSLRLHPAGFGGTKPLVPASQRGAAQINDRVDLIILEKK